MNTEGSHNEEPHDLEERRAEEDHSVVLEHPSENSATSGQLASKKSGAINAYNRIKGCAANVGRKIATGHVSAVLIRRAVAFRT